MITDTHSSLLVTVAIAVLGHSVPATSAVAAGHESWVAIFDGPERGVDFGSAIVRDDAGSLYVSGSVNGDRFLEGFDWVTVKYDATGNELWRRIYDRPTGDEDREVASAMDPAGHLLVAGQTGGPANRAATTVKYDAEGVQLWAAHYDGPDNSSDGVVAVASDAEGNVYVAGSSSGGGDQSDALIIKYDSGGNELWVAGYDGPADGPDSARALTVDGDGNVYVAGSAWTGTESDMLTLKYDTDRALRWARRYDGPGNNNDRAMAIALGPAGHVHVTGHSSVPPANNDFTTIKYDPDGNRLWVARYDGPLQKGDEANAIGVDAGGNVYVTGSSDGTGEGEAGKDIVTVKYDSGGAELWSARYDGPGQGADVANALAVGHDGSVHVAGNSLGPTSSDYTVIKYDTGGSEVCVFRYDGPGEGSDGASAIVLDDGGDVYVTGSSDTTGAGLTGMNIVTIRYTETSCPADLDGNGEVGFEDLVAVLAAWGNEGGREDLDGSGFVDFGDLLIVLDTWGPCK